MLVLLVQSRLIVLFFLLSVVVGCSSNEDELDCETQFTAFVRAFGKIYASPLENSNRKSTFCRNLALIDALNLEYSPTTRFGITQFADLTPSEFASSFLRPIVPTPVSQEHSIPFPHRSSPPRSRPPSFDWRTHGAISQVRNQGDCGSCYAFSTVGEIESQYFFKTGLLTPLSVQQIVDCDEMELGCAGGNQDNAYWYIQKFGLESWEDYPLIKGGGQGGCQKEKKKILLKTLRSYHKLEKNETVMRDYLLENGPISILMNADNLQFYKSGVWDPKKCDTSVLNHALLLTGFNVTGSGTLTWNVKNSWGDAWGEEGYFQLARGKGVCGVNLSPYASKI